MSLTVFMVQRLMLVSPGSEPVRETEKMQAWRQKRAHGDVIVVRFADDIVVGFRDKADADQFRAELINSSSRVFSGCSSRLSSAFSDLIC
jgi:hypothetical protein